MKNLSKLLEDISKCEATINKLGKSEEADRERYSELEGKRGPIATAALADNNSAAIKQLDEIDQEQWKIDRKLRGSEAAVANLTVELKRLQAEAKQLQKKLDCDHINELVKNRTALGKQVEALVRQFTTDLNQCLSGMSVIDADISDILSRLEPERFGNLAANVKSTPQSLTMAYLRHSLKNIIGLAVDERTFQPGELKSMDVVSKKFFVKLNHALEALPEGPMIRKGRLYQAQSRITGLKGHTLNPGDTVRLSPGDADELIESGALAPADDFVEETQNQSSTMIPQKTENKDANGLELA